MNVGDRVQHLSGKVRGTITAKAIDVWGNPQYFIDVDDERGDVLYSAVMLEPEPDFTAIARAVNLDTADGMLIPGSSEWWEAVDEARDKMPREDELEGLLELALPYLEHPDVNAIGFAYPVAAVAQRIRAALDRG